MRFVMAIIGTLALCAAAVAAFALLHTVTTDQSRISTGADGLRTFTVGRADGQPILCNAYLTIPAVKGLLGGQAGAPDPVWLVADDGHRMVVVWPAGFAVRFNPDVELLDDRGRSVATAGETVTLGQVSTGSAAGTHDDPYIASGLVFGGCSIYSP
jgi:hypothetical protein